MGKYSGELLPLLFTCLSKSTQDSLAGRRPRDVVRVYYAMETFCENLGIYTLLSVAWALLPPMRLHDTLCLFIRYLHKWLGYMIAGIYLFICLSVCQQDYRKKLRVGMDEILKKG